jgi:hypothetical protein
VPVRPPRLGGLFFESLSNIGKPSRILTANHFQVRNMFLLSYLIVRLILDSMRGAELAR